MKRIFPVITILIFLSLLGIIFFQVLWIRQAIDSKELQFEEHITIVTATAANELVERKGNLSPFQNRKNNDAISPLNVFPPTITHKFTRDEIRAIIKNAFDLHAMRDVPFEFSVTPTSMMGEEIKSENFS